MKILSLLFAFIALNSSPGRSASRLERGPAELSELVRKAKDNNSELKALGAELAAEKSRLGPAGSLEDPMIAVEAMNVPIDSFRMNESEMSGLQFSLSQKFPFPGKRVARQGIVELKTRAIEQRMEQLQRDIAWTVKRIYYELYLKRQKWDILENQRNFLKQALVSSRNQYALNQLPQAAILNLQVEEAQLVNEQLRVSSEMKDFEAELAHVTGHAEHLPALSFKSIKIARLNLNKLSEGEIAARVLSKNAELQALQKDIEVQDAAVSLAQKNYLPDFEVMASYTLRDSVRGMDGTRSGKDMIGARIGISLPIWGSSKQSEQIKEAIADRERASYSLENSRLMQIHQARALFAELKESLQRIDLFESGLLRLSQQAVASGRSAYLTGKLDYMTLLDSLRKQQDTEYSYQEALVSYQVQLSKLEALLGEPLGVESNE